MSLQDVAITEADVIRVTSEAGLLATQKAAPAVTDGISAEAISRSPDSDAADAITRVTGVSVVDDNFVVVRGLAERYSNSQLNGVELASPEPLNRARGEHSERQFAPARDEKMLGCTVRKSYRQKWTLAFAPPGRADYGHARDPPPLDHRRGTRAHG